MTFVANSQPAIGTKLYLGNGVTSPVSFTLIANVGDLSGPSFASTIVDVTSHSTGTPWREKVTTLLDPGTISLPLYFLPNVSSGGGHDFTSGLGSVFTSRAQRNYQMTFPDIYATTWIFSGFLSKYSITAKVAGVLEAATDLTFTGQPIQIE